MLRRWVNSIRIRGGGTFLNVVLQVRGPGRRKSTRWRRIRICSNSAKSKKRLAPPMSRFESSYVNAVLRESGGVRREGFVSFESTASTAEGGYPAACSGSNCNCAGGICDGFGPVERSTAAQMTGDSRALHSRIPSDHARSAARRCKNVFTFFIPGTFLGF